MRTSFFTTSEVLKDGLPLRLSSIKLPLLSENEVRNIIDGDRRLIVHEVADKCIISKTTVHAILVQELHMNRICVRWVPRMLSEENMTNRTEASRQFLRKLDFVTCFFWPRRVNIFPLT
jgi:hypothetical protein